MTDLSNMSTEELLALRQQAQGGDVSSMSTEELLAMREQMKGSGEGMSWSDVPGQALANAPGSAYEFGKAIAYPFMHPIDTLQNMVDLPSGAIREGARVVLPEQTFNQYDEYLFGPKEVAERSSGKAKAVGGFYADRYGSGEGFKRALASDPIGVAADAATVLTGGGAAMSKVGPLSKLGSATQMAGNAVNPLSWAAGTVRQTGKAAKNVLGMTTGTSADAVGEAYRAGAQGGKQGQAFRDNMRGKEDPDIVIDEAKTAMGKIHADQGAQYKKDMAAINADKTPIDMSPIVQKFNDTVDAAYHGGHQRYSDATMGKLKEIHKVLAEWEADPSVHNAGGLDALKQRIGDLMPPPTEGNSQATRLVTDMYNSVRDAIVKQAPDYAKAMENYEKSAIVQNELKKSLSLGKNVSADTTLRKLQSITRNNANTNYGSRAKSAQKLEDAGAKNLKSRLAGQALNTWTPRGISSISTALLTGLGSYFSPWAVPGLLAGSPRLVGEGAHLAGRAGKLANRLPLSRGGLLGARALGNAGLLGQQ